MKGDGFGNDENGKVWQTGELRKKADFPMPQKTQRMKQNTID